jgi:hypothetical protein
MEVKNFRGRAVEVEVHRSAAGDFDFESQAAFEKESFDTRKVKFTLNAGETRKIAFIITTRHGTNAR